MASLDPEELKKLWCVIDTCKQIGRTTKGDEGKLARSDVCWLLSLVRNILEKEPMMIDVSTPINVFGDIHGQLSDLLELLDKTGWPPNSRCLFLGDYVDRGNYGIETVCILFAYKTVYPRDFFVIRGNHEQTSVNRMYGFYDEMLRKYDRQLYEDVNKVFDSLPVAALVNGRILCVHGGISKSLDNLQQLRDAEKPMSYFPPQGFLTDILWADPDASVKGFEDSPRQISYVFGQDALLEFLDHHGLDMVIRAHQVAKNGVEVFAGKLITVFSARDYGGEFHNGAGAVIIGMDHKVDFVFLPSRMQQGLRIMPSESPAIVPEGSATSAVALGSASTDEVRLPDEPAASKPKTGKARTTKSPALGKKKSK